ncbi:MAG: N-acetylmuramoyl-L-alanine amidase [Deltaproteobacteria bacterium]|nr:N-acetylmuramoyl-L-alanine amidase [Deltaproteobacteria bacterium]
MRPLLTLALLCALPSSSAAKSPLIVLDPGHGGTNRGAYGATIGQHEKALTLKLARRIAFFLRELKAPARVRLTRNRDRYLTLARRATLANSWSGTLFVSLHFNASQSRTQSGFETYVLNAKASDREASRLAQLENGTREQQPRGRDAVGAILADLEQRAMYARSRRLAKQVQGALRQARPKAADRGVREAPFDVLMGLKMPGVLVEAGFIDHPDESRELNQATTFDAIAQAIAKGITSYLRRPKKVARR